MDFKQKIFIFGGIGVVVLIALSLFTYKSFEIDVPEKHIAVLIRRFGIDLENNQEIAPPYDKKVGYHKGIQQEVLNEGRYYYNPFYWDWEIRPMVEIPEGMMGVRVRLYGDDLPYGHFLATKETDKGIVADVLVSGRYPINAIVKDVNGNIIEARKNTDYVEIIELHRPITIDAGFEGVVTNLAGPLPENPNTLLVEKGFRGVQEETLSPGTHYINPYMFRIEAIDCRSQRFNLSENEEMGFPSMDGFWVSLDGIVEFRVHPETAARTYVTYNETENDSGSKHDIAEEIVRKIIMPNARSFCRLRGSNSSGRQFISGDTRTAFQEAYQKSISETCGSQGIDIIQALITKINPPKPISEPVREREVYAQRLKQYHQEKLQQDEAALLATETEMIEQKKALVEADQVVIEVVTKAKEEQGVAIEKANEKLAVVKEDFEASKDQAAAVLSESSAKAAIIVFENQALAAGWKKSVEAFDGDGEKYSQYILYQKLAPAYKSIMTNSADSPLMEVFKAFSGTKTFTPKLENKDSK
jgi:hypothetical protein